ncbi:hypothetical protein Vqi01_21660 [Micromonospora qiuiae]|uniref:OmpA-like domain-containing protein n=1 Tax=Micromonospora qiuiae TaxID=502268 RepID=A0ABQ4JA14_9ACTN|nr:hypothetical protein [Micromonospora qiuiae]GIJ27004.1 hypothetical protein Vqi01_21660 [Micromonospora qiuiae]
MWFLARRRYRAAGRDQGNLVFGTIGWLFADLMFALAMIYLVATTMGAPLPAEPEPAASASPSPSASASPTPEPVLELKPVSIRLTSVDWQGLLANDPRAIRTLQNKVRKHPGLQGRRAGLVLTFGGASNDNTDRAMRIARRANAALKKLGDEGIIFRGTVYRPFLSLASPPSALTIDVYLFKL